MREIVIGAAQMGAIQRADDRAAVVARMIALLDRAKAVARSGVMVGGTGVGQGLPA